MVFNSNNTFTRSNNSPNPQCIYANFFNVGSEEGISSLGRMNWIVLMSLAAGISFKYVRSSFKTKGMSSIYWGKLVTNHKNTIFDRNTSEY